MYPDYSVDDEFETGEPHPVIWNRREVKRAVRVCHVHGDLQRYLGHGVETDFFNIEWQFTLIDVAGFPLGTGNGYRLSIGNGVGCVSGSHHRGDTELLGDDGGMAGPTTTVVTIAEAGS